MEKLGTVHESHECRRLGGSLSHVIDLQASALIRGGLNARGGVCENVVEPAGRYADGVLLSSVIYLFKQLIHTSAVFSGNENERNIAHEAEIYLELFLKLIHSVSIFFDSIPLIYSYYTGLALFVSVARDFRILLGKTYGSVDNYDSNIGAVYRHIGAENAVTLDIFKHLRFLADTCGIYENELALLSFDIAVGSVAGSARNIGNYHPILAAKTVYNRRFTDVRLADNGYLYNVLTVILLGIFGKLFEDFIEQVARTVTVNGRYRDRLAKTQIIKFVKISRRFADVIALIYAEDNRLARLAQHSGNVLIGSGNAAFKVGN